MEQVLKACFGLQRFRLAACEAITSFNDGAKSRESLLRMLTNFECSAGSKKVLALQNKIRLQNARIKSSETHKKHRQRLRQIRKGEKLVDNDCYVPGGFSNRLEPDKVEKTEKQNAAQKDEVVDFVTSCINDSDMDLIFVHHDDKPMVIISEP